MVNNSDNTTGVQSVENSGSAAGNSGPVNMASNNYDALESMGMVNTIFAETIGLGMHNAITTQQNTQMSSSASVTSACARLLKTPFPAVQPPEKEEEELPEESSEPEVAADAPDEEEKAAFWKFWTRKKKKKEEE